MITVQTKRLVLRQWQVSDRPLFAAMNADPAVMEFFPQTLSRAQSDALIERFSHDIDTLGWGFWAAETLETNEFIGFIGINPIPQGLPFSPCVDIGWRLSTQHWGRGLATEGAKAAMSYAFTKTDIDRLVSMTPKSNLASERVMQKLAMLKQPKNFLHPNVAEGHALQEHILYTIERQQWQAVVD